MGDCKTFKCLSFSRYINLEHLNAGLKRIRKLVDNIPPRCGQQDSTNQLYIVPNLP